MFSEPRYSSVVLDVDSTVAGIEGIDWLAARRGAAVATEIAELTRRAMDAEISLESVYGDRLRAVAPTENDMDELSRAYIDAIAPGCRESITELRNAGVRLALISGGIREAILPLGRALGIPAGDIHAVGVRFDAGKYAGFDQASPLAASGGKRIVVERLGLRRPLLAVGDGATDLDMKPVADAFAAFTGFARRTAVVERADVELRSFAELTQYVLRAPSATP